MRKRLIAGLASAAALLATSANAATIVIESEGTVASGYDYAGLFGAPDTDLTGAQYRLVFTFDDELADISEPFPGGQILYGGTGANGLPSPGSAVLTIAGVDYTISGVTFGQLFANAGGTTTYDAITNTQDTEAAVSLQHNAAVSGSIYASTIGACQPADGCSGLFEFSTLDNSPQGFTTRAIGTLAPHFIGSAVPEPEAWALLIVGFGLAGAAVRQRRRQLAWTTVTT